MCFTVTGNLFSSSASGYSKNNTQANKFEGSTLNAPQSTPADQIPKLKIPKDRIKPDVLDHTNHSHQGANDTQNTSLASTSASTSLKIKIPIPKDCIEVSKQNLI